LLGSTGCRIIW